MLRTHLMIPQTSITKATPASPSWPVMFARTETYRHMGVRFAEQNRFPVQGCFPMTD